MNRLHAGTGTVQLPQTPDRFAAIEPELASESRIVSVVFIRRVQANADAPLLRDRTIEQRVDFPRRIEMDPHARYALMAEPAVLCHTVHEQLIHGALQLRDDGQLMFADDFDSGSCRDPAPGHCWQRVRFERQPGSNRNGRLNSLQASERRLDRRPG